MQCCFLKLNIIYNYCVSSFGAEYLPWVAYDEITLKTSGRLKLSEVSSFHSPAFVQQHWPHMEPYDNGLNIRE